MSPELLDAMVETRGPSKGKEFAALKSLFCDLHPITTAAGHIYQLWAQKNNVKFFYQTGGSIASAWELFEKEQIEGVVGNPTGLVNYAMGVGTNTHRFKLVLTSGAQLRPRQIPVLQNGLGKLVISSYGASEVGTIATATAEQVLATPGCVGRLSPGVSIDIETTAVSGTVPAPTPAKSASGLIKVKTSTMISGYTDPTLTAKYFQNGWFYPGDMGYLTAENLLVLTGRASGF
jgi:acyl-coenzyme A synthetase/AMP-(fatty) acid ligase